MIKSARPLGFKPLEIIIILKEIFAQINRNHRKKKELYLVPPDSKLFQM